MELTEIEAFIAIAEHGTFSRAATVLGLSQPAISRRIALLESDLGTPVFERLRRGAPLTDAGKVFLPHARSMLANLRDGMEAVSDLNIHHRGTIRLALVGTLASTPLVMDLRQFREQFRETRLIISTANSKRIGWLVSTGDVHLGLRYFADLSAEITSTRIGQERVVIARAWESRIVPDGPVTAAMLANFPWVSFPLNAHSSGEGFADLLETHVLHLGLRPPDRIQIDSLTAQKRMVEADFGVGLFPASAITEELRIGSLKVVDVAGFDAVAPIYMLQRKGGYTGAALTELIAFLTSRGREYFLSERSSQ